MQKKINFGFTPLEINEQKLVENIANGRHLKTSVRNFYSSKFLTGFTLIELLIVIAIIGILSSVVLASLNTARGKASDAAIQSNLSGMRSQAEIFMDEHGYVYAAGAGIASGACPDNASATGVNRSLFGDENIKNAIASAVAQAGGIDDVANNVYTYSYCSATASSWAIAVRLKTADDPEPAVDPIQTGVDVWCVDNTSQAKAYSYTTAGDTVASAITGGKCN
jgi:prepilin-type N-terminal cleavage/methylation domain-containing protein